MEWLNYHHLFYFWTVAREGGVSRASEVLSLAQPTISGQIKTLEENLGVQLFRRAGRRLALTDSGRMVFRYADEIFTTGRELLDELRGRPTSRPMRLIVGVADVVPKMIAYRLLEPALRLEEPVHVQCVEDKADRLLADLAVHELDVVLTDTPITRRVHVRAYSHLLGESGITFFATSALARKLRPGFPGSLDGAPVLLPAEHTALRRELDHWFEVHGLRPEIRAEFDDSALLKVFGQSGVGAFAGPSVLADEIARQFRVSKIGATDDVRERFYAVTVERQLRHPAVVAISESAKNELFA